jgi:hypothetical protein
MSCKGLERAAIYLLSCQEWRLHPRLLLLRLVRLRLLLRHLLLLVLLLSLQDCQGFCGKHLVHECSLLVQTLWELMLSLLLSWAVTHG